MLLGYLATLFAVLARVISHTMGLLEPTPVLEGALVASRRGLGFLLASLLGLCGAVLLAFPVAAWIASGFGDLDPVRTLRPLILGRVLPALAAQSLLASLLLGYLDLRLDRPVS